MLAPLEHSHVAAIKMTGETLHTILEATVLDFRQTHFAQGLFLGVLFLLILAASLRVTRLWCRSICPLGALLWWVWGGGVVGGGGSRVAAAAWRRRRRRRRVAAWSAGGAWRRRRRRRVVERRRRSVAAAAAAAG